MTYQEAHLIYRQLNKTKKFETLVLSLKKSAIRYSQARAEWSISDLETRREQDANRTRFHNAFIDACNILSRNMSTEEEDIQWRDSLGHDRKDIGDFACYLSCILGIEAR